MATQKMEALLLGTKTRFGWSEIIAILIPIFLEILQGWLEDCALSEDHAVDLLSDPGAVRMERAQRRVAIRIRQNDRSISVRDSRRIANQAIHDVIEHANENPEAVREAYREATA